MPANKKPVKNLIKFGIKIISKGVVPSTPAWDLFTVELYQMRRH